MAWTEKNARCLLVFSEPEKKPGDMKMNEKKILEMVGRLRSWCYEFLEEGPAWSREPASRIIERCNDFSSRLNENLLFLADYDPSRTWDETCGDMMETLFEGHETFDLGCGLGFIPGDVGCPGVLWLCLKSGRRAPEGWHGRLLRRKKYREMFLPKK
jgi:hypothetical protein